MAVPAAISAQPSDQTVVSGANVTFSVSASGDGLTYQWQRSTDAGVTFTDIAGATSATYTLTAPAASLNGTQYRVVVKSSAGSSVTSSAVKLSVAPAIVAPAITVDTVAQSAVAGATATFTVTASGTSIVYQWQSSLDGVTWTSIDGATNATLALSGVALSDNGKRFRVVVSNPAATVTGSAIVLTVTAATALPAIASQPAAATVTAPAAATFTVTATGSPAPSFQWQKSVDNGVTWNDIATGASYTTLATTVADTGSLFRVKVTNSVGSTVSQTAALTVNASATLPVFASQPQSTQVIVPGGAGFAATATGSPSPSYQWQVSVDGGTTFANVTGATTGSLTIPATTLADNGKRYRVVATNSQGSVPSASGTLTVTAATPTGLQGRAWSAGQAIDGNNGDAVFNAATAYVGIDDSGKAVVVFVKVDPTRFTSVLYATVGTPGNATTPASWTTPVLISAAPTSFYVLTTGATVAVAPNGNAVVAWATFSACTAFTHVTTGLCGYIATARYAASTGTWEPAVLAAETSSGSVPVVKMNSAGDVAIQYQGWLSTTGGYLAAPAVATRAVAQTSYSSTAFALTNPSMGMDEAGRVTVVGTASSGDYLSFVGTARNGFGSGVALNVGNGAASLVTNVAVGRNGQALAFYYQNVILNSAYARAGSPFQVQLAAPVANLPLLATAPRRTTVLDDGTALLYAGCLAFRRSAATDTWGSALTMPGNCIVDGYGYAMSPLGDSVNLVADTGQWSTYETATNTLVQPVAPLGTNGSGFVYGVQFPLTNLTAGMTTSLASCAPTCFATALSRSGVGVLVVLNQYARLPAPGLSNDVPLTPGHTTLWGMFLK